MNELRIAIIGAGNVGSALGRRLLDVGYPVTFGVVDETSARKARDGVDARASVRLTHEAVADADVIFLAVPGNAAAEVAATLRAVHDKTLVDCTNPVRWDGGPVWAPPAEGSNAEAIQQRAPGLRVVKGFNTFGAESHADPTVGSEPVDVLLAASDKSAMTIVADVARRAGYRPIDAGPLRNARLLENMAALWIHLALVEKHGRNIAFQLHRRPDPTT